MKKAIIIPNFLNSDLRNAPETDYSLFMQDVFPQTRDLIKTIPIGVYNEINIGQNIPINISEDFDKVYNGKSKKHKRNMDILSKEIDMDLSNEKIFLMNMICSIGLFNTPTTETLNKYALHRCYSTMFSYLEEYDELDFLLFLNNDNILGLTWDYIEETMKNSFESFKNYTMTNQTMTLRLINIDEIKKRRNLSL